MSNMSMMRPLKNVLLIILVLRKDSPFGTSSVCGSMGTIALCHCFLNCDFHLFCRDDLVFAWAQAKVQLLSRGANSTYVNTRIEALCLFQIRIMPSSRIGDPINCFDLDYIKLYPLLCRCNYMWKGAWEMGQR